MAVSYRKIKNSTKSVFGAPRRNEVGSLEWDGLDPLPDVASVVTENDFITQALLFVSLSLQSGCGQAPLAIEAVARGDGVPGNAAKAAGLPCQAPRQG